MSQKPTNAKELYYEITISMGKGKLSRRGKNMLITLADGAINAYTYYNIDDKHDCYQGGLLALLKGWYKCFDDRSENYFAYLTEIFKRGATETMNEISKKKGIDKKTENIKMYSMQSLNDGMGMTNI